MVKRLSDFVAEITILLDPLQKQIEILESWKAEFDEYYSNGNTPCSEFGSQTSDMMQDIIVSRKAHLNLIQRLLQQGKDTQTLVGGIQVVGNGFDH